MRCRLLLASLLLQVYYHPSLATHGVPPSPTQEDLARKPARSLSRVSPAAFWYACNAAKRHVSPRFSPAVTTFPSSRSRFQPVAERLLADGASPQPFGPYASSRIALGP